MICLRCSEQLDALCGFKEVARKAEDVLHQFLAYTRQLNGSTQVPHVHIFLYFLKMGALATGDYKNRIRIRNIYVKKLLICRM